MSFWNIHITSLESILQILLQPLPLNIKKKEWGCTYMYDLNRSLNDSSQYVSTTYYIYDYWTWSCETLSMGGVNYYTAGVVTDNDYYPFGMEMPGRTFSSNSYRYSFQGQEKDDEVKGSGNSINYKYRVHDARIGRFLSLDPLSLNFPWNSPYAFSENRVIDGLELEGLETFNISNKEVSMFDPTTGTHYKKTIKSLTLSSTKGKLQVIDENGVALNHFKYCEFICQMKGLRRTNKVGGDVDQSAIVTPNRNNPFKKYGAGEFELTIESNNPIQAQSVPTLLGASLDAIGGNNDVLGSVFDRAYLTIAAGLTGEARADFIKLLDNSEKSTNEVRVYNNSSFTNDEIRTNIEGSENYNSNWVIKFYDEPIMETGSSEDANDELQIQLYKTSCDECD